MRRFRAHEDSARKGSRPTSKDRRMLIRCYASRDQIRSDSYHRGNHALIRPRQTLRRRSSGSPQTYWILKFVVASFGPDSVLPTEGRISGSVLQGLGITTLIILRETWLVVYVTGAVTFQSRKSQSKILHYEQGYHCYWSRPRHCTII